MAGTFSPGRVLGGLWFGLFPALVFFWLWPINSLRVRLVIVLLAGGIVVGSLVLTWRWRRVFYALATLYAAMGVFLAIPTPWPEDRAALRQVYSEKLRAYEGCEYIWGGEGRYGMDCSGLVRRALEDALFCEGVRNFNPTLIRAAIELWWNDGTAESMGLGYEGRTRLVTQSKSLNDMDRSLLLPGDLAVTASGLHVMGYLEDGVWIGADPGEMKVTVFPLPETLNGYFSSSMKIMRWKVLEE